VQQIFIQEAGWVTSGKLIQDENGTFTNYLSFDYLTTNDNIPPDFISPVQVNYYLDKHKIQLGYLKKDAITDDSDSVIGYFRLYYDTSDDPVISKSNEEILQLPYEQFDYSDNYYSAYNQTTYTSIPDQKAVVVPKSFLYDKNASAAYLVLYDGKGNYKVYNDRPYTSFFDIYDIPVDITVDYANNKVTVKSYCLSYGHLYIDPVMASSATLYDTHSYKWDTKPGANGEYLPVTKEINSSSFSSTLKDHFMKMYLDHDANGSYIRMCYAGPVYYWCGPKNVCTLKEVSKINSSKILVKSDNAVFMHTYYSDTDFGDDITKWSIYGHEADLAEKTVTAANVGVPAGYEYSPDYSYIIYKHKTSFIHWADGSSSYYKWY